MDGQAAEGDVGLRVGVRGGGCSGFQYALALDEQRDDDHVFDASGIRVLVDPASLRYVDGSTVDFTESFQGSGFEVSNPNVVASCGCGSSFRVADEEPSLRHRRGSATARRACRPSRLVVQRAPEVQARQRPVGPPRPRDLLEPLRVGQLAQPVLDLHRAADSLVADRQDVRRGAGGT